MIRLTGEAKRVSPHSLPVANIHNTSRLFSLAYQDGPRQDGVGLGHLHS
jgi:hypothetical protein